MPAAWNHSAMSRLSAAAPETKNRTRPPNRARIFANTSRSKTLCCTASSRGTGWPDTPELVDLEADHERPVEDLLLDAAFGLGHGDHAGVRLLEDARGRPHEGRLDHREVVDDLVHPAVDRRREADGELGREEHLPERVRQRAATGTGRRRGQDVEPLDRRRPRRSRRSAEAGRPWAGRWFPRCRSGSPGGRCGCRSTRRSTTSGSSASRSAPMRLEVVERDHPAVVALGRDVRRSAGVACQGRTRRPCSGPGARTAASRSFATWVPSSANTTCESESPRMNATSSAMLDG